MILKQRIADFVVLGKFLEQFSQKQKNNALNELNDLFYDSFEELIQRSKVFNGWFTEHNVRKSLGGISFLLKENELNAWANFYKLNDESKSEKAIGVIMAGNIPLVGFHDFLCVLISGNKIKMKLASDDNKLFPALIEVLKKINNAWGEKIQIVEGMLKDADAMIATGSNNSARYFDYYFGKYPHIIRKNRNSVAVIDGNETEEQLAKLGEDIFSYFGLGCRNVSKLFVPKNYDLNKIFSALFSHQEIVNHNKYANNYDYNKTVYLLNNIDLVENGFILFKQDTSYTSPVAVLFYEYYDSIDELVTRLENDKEQIQCVVSNCSTIKNKVNFGDAQLPGLFDYADGVDVMQFLSGV